MISQQTWFSRMTNETGSLFAGTLLLGQGDAEFMQSSVQGDEARCPTYAVILVEVPMTQAMPVRLCKTRAHDVCVFEDGGLY